MKKLLLLITLLISVHGNAQSACNGTIFTSGPNALGTGGQIVTYVQNCLTYNVDLNTVLWTHRASPYWNFSGYTSGSIQTTWLNVGTNVWDSMIIYRDSTNSYGARYPGGTIFNPSGNNNIANAYMVGTGPVNATAGWIGSWYSNRKPSGSYHTVTAAQDDNLFCATGTAPFGNVSNSAYGYVGFLNADIQQVGNTVMVGGSLADFNVFATQNIVQGAIIGKGTYSGSNFTWTRDTIIPNFYLGGTNGYANDGQGARIAFSPNGQIGYALFVGRLATNFGNNADSTFSPIVYKTINGGSTWSSFPILPGFDWTVAHPEMLMNVGNLYPQKSNQFRLYFKHGIDLTVDSTGTLHIVGVVTNSIKTIPFTPDSLIYTPNENWDYKNHHPIIWDMMTDGTTWNTLLVDSLKTCYMDKDLTADTSASYNPWFVNNINSTRLAYGARIQVSRSVTGGNIFYSWADSNPIANSRINTNPDIYMKSYDISHQLVTATNNLTSGNGHCYFHYLSDISYYDFNNSSWVCPVVYTTDKTTTPPYYSTDTVNYQYLNCPAFNRSEYNAPAVVNTAKSLSISQYSNLNSQISIYPNPSNGIFTIEANVNTKQSMQVYDVTGRVVLNPVIQPTYFDKLSTGSNPSKEGNSITIDASTLPNGIYNISFTSNEGVANKRVVIAR